MWRIKRFIKVLIASKCERCKSKLEYHHCLQLVGTFAKFLCDDCVDELEKVEGQSN